VKQNVNLSGPREGSTEVHPCPVVDRVFAFEYSRGMSTDTPAPAAECEATRYAVGPCDSGVVYVVEYRSTAGALLDSHPTCFRHGIAEVDRHYASGGIAQAAMVDAPRAD